ncbi:BtrH N-terminal domain-containing protein [Chloroflexota bacterium]
MITVNDFKVFEAKHCETAATKSLLRHENFDISEPMMLGLSQGFGFIYWKMSFMNLPFIGGRAKPFELTRMFCQNMGLELDERETTSKKKAWLNISESIDRGVPVGLQLDCYHLEHFKHSFHFAGHFIAVYGYDSSHAYVFDTGKKYKVSLENLEKARFEKGSMAAKACSYTIKKGSNTSAIKAVIPKALHEIAKEFLNPPLKCFGHSGIHKLGNEMIKWLDSAPNPKRDLYDQADLMENGGTGGAIFRNFFRDFLYECLDHLPGNINISKGGDLYKQAAVNWTEIAHLIMKAGDSGERKYLEKASQICIQTADIEKEAMKFLCNV